MTERCQKKFTEKFDNQNYIICFGILTVSIAVLYYYRFHFVTLAFSYVLGCVACYYGLNSNFLHNYLCKLQCHFFGEPPEVVQIEKAKGCVTCGSKKCDRHDDSVTTEPWVGLQIHKQLDQAIEDFYNTILEQFVNSWYSKITLQPFFLDELKHQLRYASACLLQRAVKINYSRFITERLLPCALRHYTLCSDCPIDATLASKLAVHPAAANRNAELKYLRCITNAIMPYLLKNNDIQNSVFRVLIREIFAGWVLLSLTDVLADPYILNTLIILATGDETMAQLPTTPNYKVEFLETFVRQTESLYTQRCKLFKLDLDLVINDQEYFYSFMQYMKNTSHLHLLQFYKDIKSFQTKILNPELTDNEKASLHNEACDIYSLYISAHSIYRVPLHTTLAQELYELLQCKDSIKRLQTSRALYQAARQSHAVLEKIMLPRFLHNEEFYKLLLGSRIPTGYQKHMFKKPQERLLNTAIKLGNKLRGALRTPAIEGQILDCYTNMDELEPNDDNIDILKYLENITAEESLDGNDLTKYKVVLTNIETVMQVPPRRGCVRVMEVGVHCAAAMLHRSLRRTEHDFHLLRSKLHEFHGDALLHDLPLPSRRDNSPLETIRYKYEDFLQRLLQKSLLQTSELLRLFLTEDGDFSLAVQASTLNANSTDLLNIYQSVTHKLRKEKGQHLESFLRNLLVSSDRDRYQALKQGREVEEATEVSEEIEEQTPVRPSNVRDISNTVFGNNFNMEPDFVITTTGHQNEVVGFTQCFMYLLIKVIRVHSFISGVVGTVLSYVRSTLDGAVDRYLNSLLHVLLSERRLAHLIRLGQQQIFGKKSSTPRMDSNKHRELARRQLLDKLQYVVLLEAGLRSPINKAFEIIQEPRLNKQLVYNLLDLCVVELFPELKNEDTLSNDGPKS